MVKTIENFDPSNFKMERVEEPDLSEIKKFLNEKIKGQPDAVEKWSKIINQINNGVVKLKKGPFAIVTELGPSGVGKTQMVKTVVDYLKYHNDTFSSENFSDDDSDNDHGNINDHDRYRNDHENYRDNSYNKKNKIKSDVLKINCGEYQESFEVSKLIGSPPGYAGHDQTEPRLSYRNIKDHSFRVGDKNYTFVLFDEIEKAHPDLNVTLLGALDDGVMTLGNGEQVDLSETIVVFTSNLGNEKIIEENKKRELSEEEKKIIQKNAITSFFKPEQLSRMGGEKSLIYFKQLDKKIIKDISLEKLKEYEKTASSDGRNISFSCTEQALEKIVDEGYSPDHGVRILEIFLDETIGTSISLIKKQEGEIPVVIDLVDGKITLFIPKKDIAAEKDLKNELVTEQNITHGLRERSIKIKEEGEEVRKLRDDSIEHKHDTIPYFHPIDRIHKEF